MPLHPTIAAAIRATSDLPGYESLPIADARRRAKQGYVFPTKSAVGSVEDRQIELRDRRVGIRIYRPGSEQRLPAIVFFHGSGFCLLDLDTHDEICRFLCRNGRCVVVSVDYRLAPEWKFPAGPDDAFDASEWVFGNAAALGIDDTQIVLAGDSAGGNIAIVTALRRKAQGLSATSALLLFYPVTDHYDAGHRSYDQFRQGFGLTAHAMRWGWDMYLDDLSASSQPLVSPNRTDLAGLPPAYLQIAEYDVLRDEGRQFADRLRQAAVPTFSHYAEGLNHGYLRWIGQIDVATSWALHACAWLQSHWNGQQSNHNGWAENA
ncbi:alpha/beta hydrolase [Pararhizobium sp. A13]|uniref:alpha/beta hydrolase n=1 Tax=Pararhizobium sp. A13 TaxID=3133975 RepID=UPI00324D625C